MGQHDSKFKKKKKMIVNQESCGNKIDYDTSKININIYICSNEILYNKCKTKQIREYDEGNNKTKLNHMMLEMRIRLK